MKIAFLIQDCTTVGGTERVTCRLASEMARQGNDVSIVSVFGTGGKCCFPLDSRVTFVVACDADYSLRMSMTHRMAILLKMAHILKDNPLLHDADVVIAQKFFAALMAVRAGFSRKLIVGDHYPYRLYRQPLLWFRNMIYRRAKVVVVLTEGSRQEFLRNGVNNVVAVGNMLTLEPVNNNEEREKMILAVGRLTKEKGFDSLIMAVSRIKDKIDGWHVAICGDGEQRPLLERMIHEHGLEDKVVLHGKIHDVAAMYARASLGVVPSRYEGFSLVLLEAAAMRLPMVAFNCPYGPGEILGNGGGLLVPDQDIDALASAILRMTQDESLRSKCASETSNIVERFSPAKIYSQWMRIIEKYL